MKSPSFRVTDGDREFFKRELESFTPDRLYDAHMHLGLRSDYSAAHSQTLTNTPEVADMETYRSHMEWLVPGREIIGAMVLPTTLAGERMDEGNHFAAREAAKDNYSGSSVLIHPDMTADKLRSDIERYNPVSLKPYHLMSPRRPTQDSFMTEFLPEHTVAVAHEAKLPIVMHMVRSQSLADITNQQTIRTYCEKYPDMQMVLAHNARGFNPSHTINGIHGIAGLHNVFFDNSCACESGAAEAILNEFGPSKLMWGSDFPFSHLRGKAIGVNDKLIWLMDGNDDSSPVMKEMEKAFTLVGLESLRALKFACMAYKLSDSEVRAIFCDNAMELYKRRS